MNTFTALDLFQQVITVSPDHTKASYYRGVALHQPGEIDQTQTIFHTIANQDYHTYAQDAERFLKQAGKK